MTDFDEFCSKLEAMDKEQIIDAFNMLSKDVIKALMEVSQDGKFTVDVYIRCVLAAVAADGVLSEPEFEIMKPAFDLLTGKDLDYAGCVEAFNSLGFDDPSKMQESFDAMADIIGLVSPEIKDDLVFMSLMVCAIDGEITEDEKDWIKRLVEPPVIDVTPAEVVSAFLDEAKVFTLATTDGDQPRTRVLGFKTELDGRLYFAVGTHKDVYAQLMANPKCEIMAFVGDRFLRWDGTAVFNDDQRLPMAAGAAMPEIAQMYAANGWTLGFFTLVNSTAEVVSIDGSKTRLF